jgi:hypothetical protein
MVSYRFETVKKTDPEAQVSLRMIDDMFGEDGAPLTIIFLCLPFLFPMPIPGISTAFGMAMILLTIRAISPRPLPLPKIADRITLRGQTVVHLAEKSHKYALKLERLMKPRFLFMTRGIGRYVCGVCMILSAIALALPIPPVIPLTNTLPALAITFFSLGLLMRDGLMSLLGHLLHVVSWGYFVSVASVAFAFAAEAIEYLKKYL